MPQQTTVSITRDAYNRMIALCQRAWPCEACGVLSRPQSAEDSDADIAGVYSVSNASSKPEIAFVFDPQSWIDTCYEMRRNRQIIAGFFHSHPRGQPVPSAADLAGWPGDRQADIWIISLSDRGNPVTSAYRLVHDTPGASMFAQISVQVT